MYYYCRSSYCKHNLCLYNRNFIDANFILSFIIFLLVLGYSIHIYIYLFFLPSDWVAVLALFLDGNMLSFLCVCVCAIV